MTMPDIITDVAKYKKGWSGGLPETECGFGSKVAQTSLQRRWLPDMVGRHGIHTIADIGAGDLGWIKLVQWPHKVDYKPYDLVPRHELVEPFDIIQSIPEPVDCLLCLWLLNHLPEDHAQQALINLLASGSKYLIMTWESRIPAFLDLPALEKIVIRERNDERGNVEMRLVKL